MNDLRPTARERAVAALETNPDGLSFNRLLKEVGGNTNVLRKAVAKLIRDGLVQVEEERTVHGDTLIHTLVRPEDRGQLTIDDAA